ncbi:hypothetical protein V8C26DRAFT_17910 [Trichoderma gracile]
MPWLRPPLPSGFGAESAKMRFAETPVLSFSTIHNRRGCTRSTYLMLSSFRGLLNETADETWGAGFAAYCSKHRSRRGTSANDSTSETKQKLTANLSHMLQDASAYEQKPVAYKQATKQPTSLLFNLGGQGGIDFNETHTHDMDVSLACSYGRVPSQTRFLDCQMHEAALAWLVRLLPKGAVSKTAVRGVLEAGRRIVHFQGIPTAAAMSADGAPRCSTRNISTSTTDYIELVCTSCLPSMGALQVNMYVTSKDLVATTTSR